MRRAQAFPSNYLGKEDFSEVDEIVATISDVVPGTVKGDHGDETRTIMHFSESNVKPLIINNTNWMATEDAYGEESDDWIGKQVVLYVDPNVMYGPKRVGGVRIKIPRQGTPSIKPGDSLPGLDTPASVCSDGQPPMTKKEALAACLNLDINPETLGLHLKAGGQGAWDDIKCAPLVRQLIRMETAARAAEAKLENRDTSDLDNDIPF